LCKSLSLDAADDYFLQDARFSFRLQGRSWPTLVNLARWCVGFGLGLLQPP